MLIHTPIPAMDIDSLKTTSGGDRSQRRGRIQKRQRNNRSSIVFKPHPSKTKKTQRKIKSWSSIFHRVIYKNAFYPIIPVSWLHTLRLGNARRKKRPCHVQTWFQASFSRIIASNKALKGLRFRPTNRSLILPPRSLHRDRIWHLSTSQQAGDETLIISWRDKYMHWRFYGVATSLSWYQILFPILSRELIAWIRPWVRNLGT